MSAKVAYLVPRPARTKPLHRAEANTTDPVFFHKSKVRVGTRFRYYGRMDPGTVWEVQSIRTYSKSPDGYVTRSVDRVRHLNDDINMVCVTAGRESDQPRTVTFSYLSYSAIWRLA